MFTKKSLAIRLAVMFAVATFGQVYGASFPWQVYGTFQDGAVLSGTMIFDPLDINQPSIPLDSVALTVTGGAPYANQPNPFTYTTENSAVSLSAARPGENPPFPAVCFSAFSPNVESFTREIDFCVADRFTEAGGYIPMLSQPGLNFPGETLVNEDRSETYTRIGQGGYMQGTPNTPIPEPSAAALLLTGLIAAGLSGLFRKSTLRS